MQTEVPVISCHKRIAVILDQVEPLLIWVVAFYLIEELRIKLNTTRVKQVDKFIYLGSEIYSEGQLNKIIQNSSKFYQITKGILCNGKIPKHCKTAVINPLNCTSKPFSVPLFSPFLRGQYVVLVSAVILLTVFLKMYIYVYICI
jgi:hypothetical protein